MGLFDWFGQVGAQKAIIPQTNTKTSSKKVYEYITPPKQNINQSEDAKAFLQGKFIEFYGNSAPASSNIYTVPKGKLLLIWNINIEISNQSYGVVTGWHFRKYTPAGVTEVIFSLSCAPNSISNNQFSGFKPLILAQGDILQLAGDYNNDVSQIVNYYINATLEDIQ